MKVAKFPDVRNKAPYERFLINSVPYVLFSNAL